MYMRGILDKQKCAYTEIKKGNTRKEKERRATSFQILNQQSTTHDTECCTGSHTLPLVVFPISSLLISVNTTILMGRMD